MPAAETPRRRRRALTALTAALALALTACAGDAQEEPAAVNPHGPATAAASGPSSSGAASSAEGSGDGSAASGAEGEGVDSLDLGDRRDQAMAEAAAARAADYGFVRQRAATAEEIATTRQDNRARLSDATRTVVEPASCKAPVTAQDFSPILLDTEEVTRVDVGADSFTGTGTIEVALLDGPSRQRVERHLQTLNTLVADCAEIEMTVTEGDTSVDFVLTNEAAELSEGSPAQSGIVWQRRPASDEGHRLTAQVLTAVTPDAVVMVSFAGQEASAERQFTVMAEEIIAAARAAG